MFSIINKKITIFVFALEKIYFVARGDLRLN